jgi:hypothetical protein
MSRSAYPSPKELEVLYARRDAAVASLGGKDRITAADLAVLDRLGRCKVANEHWAICDEPAHHFVRSCAQLAA